MNEKIPWNLTDNNEFGLYIAFLCIRQELSMYLTCCNDYSKSNLACIYFYCSVIIGVVFN